MLLWKRVYKYFFKTLFFCSLGYIPRVELLDHILFSVFIETTILFSTVAVPSYIPSHSAQGFQFFHILANTCYFLFFFFLIVAIRCEGISHISVDFCFPKSFTQSWIRWFVCLLLLLNFRSSLCIFWILIPYIRFANIFLSFCGLPLYTMNNVFVEKHRFKIFMKSSLSIFSFVTCTFGVIS